MQKKSIRNLTKHKSGPSKQQKTQTFAKTDDLEKFLKSAVSRSGKNSVKYSWLQIVIRIGAQIERFVVCETSHPSQTFIRIRKSEWVNE